MNFKSIKWRLQLWYGLILVVVLVGFGVTAHELERNRIFHRVDDETHRRIGALAQQLHGPPHRPQQGRPPGDFPPPPEFSDGGPPGGEEDPPKFHLTPKVAALFETNNSDKFYFIIEGRDHNIIARSDYQPRSFDTQVTRPGAVNAVPVIGQRPAEQAGPWREMADVMPSGEMIRVGCSIAPEKEELRIETMLLTGVGSIVLLFGLAGGGWFVSRALRPISEISATAAKISAGDLSQRINSAGTQSELGQLAAVLNSTFARLETAFAQQKQFASDAAHELRTPVSVILTQTQMALGRERDAATYKQTVEACERAAQRMRKLIESLLELARFDAGQEVLKQLHFDLAKTAADSVDLVQPLAGELRVKIIFEIQRLEMTGDAERLAQVVTNLLTNAIQYNKPGGEVRVKLAGQGGLAVLEISDTGRGIASGDLPHVFERFYRADKARSGAGNAGLGLSICKAIVEAHGGTIEVSSRENIGSTFLVRLPLGSTAL
jgi:heavy metal sensor kinase